jgi:hypothetical protein
MRHAAVLVLLAAAGCVFGVEGLPIGTDDLGGPVGGDDLAVVGNPDLAGVDLAGVDLASNADLTMTTQPDLTQSSLDLSQVCLPGCAAACAPCCADSCSGVNSCTQNCSNSNCNCTLSCTQTSQCQFNCSGGSTCTASGSHNDQTNFSCSGGSTCTFICDHVANNGCVADCTGGSHCRLTCTNSASCMFNNCDVTTATCPDGSIVCNQPC